MNSKTKKNLNVRRKPQEEKKAQHQVSSNFSKKKKKLIDLMTTVLWFNFFFSVNPAKQSQTKEMVIRVQNGIEKSLKEFEFISQELETLKKFNILSYWKETEPEIDGVSLMKQGKANPSSRSSIRKKPSAAKTKGKEQLMKKEISPPVVLKVTPCTKIGRYSSGVYRKVNKFNY